MNRRTLALGLLALASGAVAAPGAAAPIVVPISGTITELPDPFGLVDPSIQVGSPFAGSYTLDSDGATNVTVDPLGPVFYALATPGTLDVTVAGLPFSEPFDAVGIGDGFPHPVSGDPIDLWASFVTLQPGFDGVVFAVDFWDSTATKLGSTELFINQELAGWDHAELSISRIQIFEGGGWSTTLLARGSITAIPEPSTGALLAMGLLAVGAWRRRRASVPPARSGATLTSA